MGDNSGGGVYQTITSGRKVRSLTMRRPEGRSIGTHRWPNRQERVRGEMLSALVAQQAKVVGCRRVVGR